MRLDELAKKVVEELTSAALAIELVGSAPVLIRAVPLAITRVLRNLLTNATTHGSCCGVSVQVQQLFAVVVIEDSGPGVPEAVMALAAMQAGIDHAQASQPKRRKTQLRPSKRTND